MIPFKNLLRLFAGDFVAKVLFFVAFVYLARVFGVSDYGVLEFSLSILTYFLVLGDGGLELWATREAARGQDVATLVGRVMPLRLLLATLTYGLLLLLLPVFPDYPYLRTLLILFGLTLFAQAVSMKWVFMGGERMGGVGSGLVVAQIVFALAIFAFVRDPSDLFWVPVLRVVGDAAMAVYFGWLFVNIHGRFRPAFTLRQGWQVLRPALVMGASHGLAFMGYNFDSLLLGFMIGSDAVGWYGAAYKPITAILALPVTYFVGLFPTLSRTFMKERAEFQAIVTRSLHLTAILSLPIGVGGTFLAGSIIQFLFGDAYENSVLPLQILSWAAVLIILRGTFRQSLNAAGRQDLDLRCAGIAIATNVSLNLAIIPRFSFVGAAVTTLVAEMVWITLISWYFYRHVERMSLLPYLYQPLMAALAMGVYLQLAQPLFWMVRAATGVILYFIVLYLLGEPIVRSSVKSLVARG